MKDGMRLAMFVSGSGVTAEAIWRAAQSGCLYGVNPVLLIASSNKAGAIPRLLSAGFPEQQVVVIRPSRFETEEAYGSAILGKCRECGIDHIALLGYLKKLPLAVVSDFIARSQTQPPGFLAPPHPDFGGDGMYGLRVHWAVHYFAHHNPHRDFFWTAATAQRVGLKYDKGEVIEEEAILFDPELTPAGFPERQIIVIKPSRFAGEEEHINAILSACQKFGIDHIALLGYLKRLPGVVLWQFRGRSQNQHPGILDPPHPDFGGDGMYGLRVHWAVHYFSHNNPHRQIFFTAATAQRVELEYGKGEVVEEETILLDPDWSPADIQKNLLPVEWRTQIRALQKFANGCACPARRKRPIFSGQEILILKQAKSLAKLAIP